MPTPSARSSATADLKQGPDGQPHPAHPGKAGQPKPGAGKPGVALLGLSALGIVFGDIGTSPLYTLKTVLTLGGNAQTPGAVLGLLSLIIWTLFIVTTIKYVIVAMSIDHDGEGGILALMSLLSQRKHKRKWIVALGLLGAALIYGDGAITPAISVLSALEGLNAPFPALRPYVLPGAVAVLVGLFLIQPKGTSTIGRAFGPIMVCWFLTIAALGIHGIVKHPGVLAALNPIHAFRYMVGHGLQTFLVLGGVFLCVTGAEALYADMGHFGPAPIRGAWLLLVFPSLVLNYAGQAAIALDGASIEDNIFFQLCPDSLRIPMVALATVATIIASQSIITGAFSMTKQAIQLGWMPRLQVKHTSAEGYGQIYVGAVNWLLLLATVGLTLAFRKSDNLAAAYGIAVSLTMLMTSVLLYVAMREVWKWNRIAAGALSGLFMCVDAAFFGANSLKLLQGGYVPVVLAGLVYTLMYVWHRGSAAVAATLHGDQVPVAEFMQKIEEHHIARVPGTAVFITRAIKDVPPVMVWHVKKNRSLHERLLALTVVPEPVPRIHAGKHLRVTPLARHFWRATAHYGFMERPDIPALLKEAPAQGCDLHLNDLTYYVGHETIVAREDGKGLAGWQEELYAAMARNSMHVRDFFRLPGDHVVELGRQVSI
ncbi:MAG TPA: KUP/HAK/KT family potassium transporter [Steroidobacteraceae bacterium]|nr:KUP/HAK/KT family potassium transporter [Steroidobacteraceae bacterium]